MVHTIQGVVAGLGDGLPYSLTCVLTCSHTSGYLLRRYCNHTPVDSVNGLSWFAMLVRMSTALNGVRIRAYLPKTGYSVQRLTVDICHSSSRSVVMVYSSIQMLNYDYYTRKSTSFTSWCSLLQKQNGCFPWAGVHSRLCPSPQLLTLTHKTQLKSLSCVAVGGDNKFVVFGKVIKFHIKFVKF